MKRVSIPLRWLLPAFLVLAWLAAAGPLGALGGKLSTVQQNDSAAFLPDSAESTRVTELERRFQDADALPVILLWAGPAPLDVAARTAIDQRIVRAGQQLQVSGALSGSVSPAVPSADGTAIEAVLPLRSDVRDRLPQIVADLRDLPPVDGTAAYVTGPAGLFADFANGFSGIDGLLLVTAFGVVLLILLVVYRSPLLPLLIIGTAGLALSASTAVAYLLADQGWIAVNGQSQGIAAIVVVGAATDYGLLLVSRFREELRREPSRFTAMGTALRRSWAPIVASGSTVILGVLCLLLSDLANNRGLGPICAVSIVLALLAALTFLPAALVLLGRAAFWPYVPRSGSAAHRGRGWQRVAGLVGRHPARVLGLTVVGLVALAAFAPTFDARGTSLADAVRGGSPAAAGQQVLARHFDVGGASPAVIVTPVGGWPAVARAAAALPGVVRVTPYSGTAEGSPSPGTGPTVAGGLVRLDATLSQAPDSDAALSSVDALRTAVHRADPQALVGGSTASSLDARNAGLRDLRVIVPAVLLVIVVVLALLLRALVAPLLLVASVAISVTATVGVAALVFSAVGSPSSDPGVLLIGFVFLVALGVDYNIFLMTRAREESAEHGTREGVLRALTVTGGVITSAGLVLAATFGALSVLPLTILAQLAFLVAFGVLLDTLVVRTLTVPAAVALLGDRTWWPGRLGRRPTRHASPARPTPVPTSSR